MLQVFTSDAPSISAKHSRCREVWSVRENILAEPGTQRTSGNSEPWLGSAASSKIPADTSRKAGCVAATCSARYLHVDYKARETKRSRLGAV